MPESKLKSKKTSKRKLPSFLEVNVELTHIGGWNQSGMVACTYTRPLGGQVQVISKGHLYHWIAGRDLYPTPEQFDALCAGQSVVFGRSQWA